MRSPIPTVKRLMQYVDRYEVRAKPVNTLLRRGYFEMIRTVAPHRMHKLHRSSLRGTTYTFQAPLTESIGRSVFLYGVYEPLATAVFASLLTDGDVAIDVGAHYGDFTLAAAFQVGPSGAVYAFEPQPLVRSVLLTNLRHNDIHHVTVLDCAVADYDGSSSLYSAIDPSHTGGASLSETLVDQSRTHMDVSVRQLDGLLIESVGDRLAAVKIDVEGAEAAVLRGASDLVRRSKAAILFEANGLQNGPQGVSSETISFLRESGYLVYGMVPDGQTFRLEELAHGQDPGQYCEPWLALNLLAMVPGSKSESKLRAEGRMP